MTPVAARMYLGQEKMKVLHADEGVIHFSFWAGAFTLSGADTIRTVGSFLLEKSEKLNRTFACLQKLCPVFGKSAPVPQSDTLERCASLHQRTSTTSDEIFRGTLPLGLARS